MKLWKHEKCKQITSYCNWIESKQNTLTIAEIAISEIIMLNLPTKNNYAVAVKSGHLHAHQIVNQPPRFSHTMFRFSCVDEFWRAFEANGLPIDMFVCVSERYFETLCSNESIRTSYTWTLALAIVSSLFVVELCKWSHRFHYSRDFLITQSFQPLFRIICTEFEQLYWTCANSVYRIWRNEFSIFSENLWPLYYFFVVTEFSILRQEKWVSKMNFA